MCQDCETGLVSRRTLFTGGLVLAAGMAASTLPAMAQSDEPRPASPDEAIKRLMGGNARYMANAAINTDHSASRTSRSQGQQPFAAIVSCADSRVVPELLFDQGPGDLFVVRVAGNFINEDGLASLEYAAAVLGIQAIMVLGHAACGAVDATIRSIQDNELPPGHLPTLVNAIRPAVYDAMRDDPEDLLMAATRQNAVLNAAAAASADPILLPLHADGTIKSVSAIYTIADGAVALI